VKRKRDAFEKEVETKNRKCRRCNEDVKKLEQKVKRAPRDLAGEVAV
jgi:hypothetical protein